MKKKLLAAAVVGALAAPAAFAQTLYGIVDLGYQNAKHSDGDVNKDFVVQGQHSGSRLGVRGSEDLAGGTYAMYQIEFNIQADTGSPAATGTQRLTLVGLGSKAWGELTLGRQYTHTFHTFAVGSAAAYGTFASAFGPTPITVRNSNSIKYSSPKIGGFNIGAIWSPSGLTDAEPTAAGAESNYWDAALRWTPGPFGAALSHARNEVETLGVESETTINQVSANWDNRAFGIYGNWTNSEVDAAGVTAGDDTVWSLSGVARFGGRHEVYLMYGQGEDDVNAGSEGSFWGVAYQHVMSKRTRVYLGYGDVDNDPGASFTPTGFAVAPVSATNPTGMQPGYDPRGFQIGVLHAF